jgi:hypothetical protein
MADDCIGVRHADCGNGICLVVKHLFLGEWYENSNIEVKEGT